MKSRKLKVYVTQDQINNGCPRTADNCPATQALWSPLKHFSIVTGITTTPILICIWLDYKFTAIPTPLKVKKFIDAFDNDKKVKPFSFKIKIDFLTKKEFDSINPR